MKGASTVATVALIAGVAIAVPVPQDALEKRHVSSSSVINGGTVSNSQRDGNGNLASSFASSSGSSAPARASQKNNPRPSIPNINIPPVDLPQSVKNTLRALGITNIQGVNLNKRAVSSTSFSNGGTVSNSQRDANGNFASSFSSSSGGGAPAQASQKNTSRKNTPRPNIPQPTIPNINIPPVELPENVKDTLRALGITKIQGVNLNKRAVSSTSFSNGRTVSNSQRDGKGNSASSFSSSSGGGGAPVNIPKINIPNFNIPTANIPTSVRQQLHNEHVPGFKRDVSSFSSSTGPTPGHESDSQCDENSCSSSFSSTDGTLRPRFDLPQDIRDQIQALGIPLNFKRDVAASANVGPDTTGTQTVSQSDGQGNFASATSSNDPNFDVGAAISQALGGNFPGALPVQAQQAQQAQPVQAQEPQQAASNSASTPARATADQQPASEQPALNIFGQPVAPPTKCHPENGCVNGQESGSTDTEASNTGSQSIEQTARQNSNPASDQTANQAASSGVTANTSVGPSNPGTQVSGGCDASGLNCASSISSNDPNFNISQFLKPFNIGGVAKH